MSKKGFFISFFILLVTCIFSLLACGPSKQELVERARRREAAEAKLAQLKQELKESAAQRRAKGADVPPAVEDPGYKVGNCTEPVLPDDMSAITAPGIGSFVCGNTEAGRKILDYRKWYCQGTELNNTRYSQCVLSTWENGEPTFENVIQYTYTSAIAFEESPAQTATIAPYKLD